MERARERESTHTHREKIRRQNECRKSCDWRAIIHALITFSVVTVSCLNVHFCCWSSSSQSKTINNSTLEEREKVIDDRKNCLHCCCVYNRLKIIIIMCVARICAWKHMLCVCIYWLFQMLGDTVVNLMLIRNISSIYRLYIHLKQITIQLWSTFRII